MFCGSFFKLSYLFVKCNAFILKRENSTKKYGVLEGQKKNIMVKKDLPNKRKLDTFIAIITSLIQT